MVSALVASKETRLNAHKPNNGRLAYTAKEVCQILGISAKSLSRLEQRGLIRSSKALRTKLYPRTEIERFLEQTLA